VYTQHCMFDFCVVLKLALFFRIFEIITYMFRAVFLKLGSTKGCQWFQEMKSQNGGRVLLMVQNLYVQIKICVAIFNTNHSVTLDSCTWNLL
jgi:hypothetical protein